MSLNTRNDSTLKVSPRFLFGSRWDYGIVEGLNATPKQGDKFKKRMIDTTSTLDKSDRNSYEFREEKTHSLNKVHSNDQKSKVLYK